MHLTLSTISENKEPVCVLVSKYATVHSWRQIKIVEYSAYLYPGKCSYC